MFFKDRSEQFNLSLQLAKKSALVTFFQELDLALQKLKARGKKTPKTTTDNKNYPLYRLDLAPRKKNRYFLHYLGV